MTETELITAGYNIHSMSMTSRTYRHEVFPLMCALYSDGTVKLYSCEGASLYSCASVKDVDELHAAERAYFVEQVNKAKLALNSYDGLMKTYNEIGLLAFGECNY